MWWQQYMDRMKPMGGPAAAPGPMDTGGGIGNPHPFPGAGMSMPKPDVQGGGAMGAPEAMRQFAGGGIYNNIFSNPAVQEKLKAMQVQAAPDLNAIKEEMMGKLKPGMLPPTMGLPGIGGPGGKPMGPPQGKPEQALGLRSDMVLSKMPAPIVKMPMPMQPIGQDGWENWVNKGLGPWYGGGKALPRDPGPRPFPGQQLQRPMLRPMDGGGIFPQRQPRTM